MSHRTDQPWSAVLLTRHTAGQHFLGKDSPSPVADQPDICAPVQMSWGTPADVVSEFDENLFYAHSHVTLVYQ